MLAIDHRLAVMRDDRFHALANAVEVLLVGNAKCYFHMEIPTLGNEANGIGRGVEDGGKPGIVGGAAPCPLGHAEGGEGGTLQRRLVAKKSRVGGIGAGIAAFHVVDAQLVQQGRNQPLVLDGEIHARGLRAIAQRGVEEVEPFFRRRVHLFASARGASRKETQRKYRCHRRGRTIYSKGRLRRACTAAAELCQPLIMRP